MHCDKTVKVGRGAIRVDDETFETSSSEDNVRRSPVYLRPTCCLKSPWSEGKRVREDSDDSEEDEDLEDMNSSKLGDKILEWTREIESLRKKSKNLQGGISGRMKRNFGKILEGVSLLTSRVVTAESIINTEGDAHAEAQVVQKLDTPGGSDRIKIVEDRMLSGSDRFIITAGKIRRMSLDVEEQEEKEVKDKEKDRTMEEDGQSGIPGKRGKAKHGGHLTLQEEMKTTRLVGEREILVCGLKNLSGQEMISHALAQAGGCQAGEIRVGCIRSAQDGLGFALVRLPWLAASRVVPLGCVTTEWCEAKIRLVDERLIPCVKCWQHGHDISTCTSSVDRSKLLTKGR